MYSDTWKEGLKEDYFMGADKGEYDNICPFDYAYSKYFLKHSIIIKSAISDFFFFEG